MSEWLNTARGGLVLHVENEYLLVARSLRYGQEQWNFCLDGPTISSPALPDGMVFVATKTGILSCPP
jgi:hypothetical protein